MTIDANLLFGLWIGFGLAIALALILVVVVAWQAYKAGYKKGWGDAEEEFDKIIKAYFDKDMGSFTVGLNTLLEEFRKADRKSKAAKATKAI